PRGGWMAAARSGSAVRSGSEVEIRARPRAGRRVAARSGAEIGIRARPKARRWAAAGRPKTCGREGGLADPGASHGEPGPARLRARRARDACSPLLPEARPGLERPARPREQAALTMPSAAALEPVAAPPRW